jgi:hypothetical protein
MRTSEALYRRRVVVGADGPLPLVVVPPRTRPLHAAERARVDPPVLVP